MPALPPHHALARRRGPRLHQLQTTQTKGRREVTWVKLDDGFLTHPKALTAGKGGRALWLAGLLFAGRTPAPLPEKVTK